MRIGRLRVSLGCPIGLPLGTPRSSCPGCGWVRAASGYAPVRSLLSERSVSARTCPRLVHTVHRTALGAQSLPPTIGCGGAAEFCLYQHPAPVLAVTVTTTWTEDRYDDAIDSISLTGIPIATPLEKAAKADQANARDGKPACVAGRRAATALPADAFGSAVTESHSVKRAPSMSPACQFGEKGRGLISSHKHCRRTEAAREPRWPFARAGATHHPLP